MIVVLSDLCPRSAWTDRTSVPSSRRCVAKVWRLCRARHKRHTFAVRALEASPDGRERTAKHMLALSTYLGHIKVSHTYWYLEATPELMEGIAARCESFVAGGQP